MTMYGPSIKKPETLNHDRFFTDPNQQRSQYNSNGKECTSVQGQRFKPRVNTSLDTKANMKNRLQQNYLNKVNINDSFNVQNLFGGNFVTSNAIRLTPRQVNRKFGNFVSKFGN